MEVLSTFGLKSQLFQWPQSATYAEWLVSSLFFPSLKDQNPKKFPILGAKVKTERYTSDYYYWVHTRNSDDHTKNSEEYLQGLDSMGPNPILDLTESVTQLWREHQGLLTPDKVNFLYICTIMSTPEKGKPLRPKGQNWSNACFNFYIFFKWLCGGRIVLCDI